MLMLLKYRIYKIKTIEDQDHEKAQRILRTNIVIG